MKTTTRRLRAGLILSVLALLLIVNTTSHAAESRHILRPTLAAPTLLVPGENLDVHIKKPATATVYRVWLHRSFAQDQIYDLEQPAAVEDSFSLEIPADTPAGMYDLCVTLALNGKQRSQCEAHAVALLDTRAGAFRFAVISDVHLGDPRTEEANPGIPTDELRLKGIHALNSSGVDFVIATGDITSYPMTYPEDYPAAYDLFAQNLRVPVFILPGNHDLFNVMAGTPGGIEGASFWQKTFGPLHSAFTFGNKRFIGVNTDNWTMDVSDAPPGSGAPGITRGINGMDEYEWLAAELDHAKTSGLEPLVFGHHGMGSFDGFTGDGARHFSRDALTDMMRDAGARYYFHGHAHSVYEKDWDGLTAVCTGTFGSNVKPDSGWGFRVVNVNENGELNMEVVEFWRRPE